MHCLVMDLTFSVIIFCASFICANGRLSTFTYNPKSSMAFRYNTEGALKFPSVMPVSEQHKGLFEMLAKALSEDDETKKQILTKPIRGFQIMRTCYLDSFRYFMRYCMPFYDKIKGLKEFRDLFHRSCEADWLKTKNITSHLKNICLRKEFITEEPVPA